MIQVHLVKKAEKSLGYPAKPSTHGVCKERLQVFSWKLDCCKESTNVAMMK